MKIAIIEDRVRRLEQFSEVNLKEYKSVTIITGGDFDNLTLSLKSNDTKSLDSYRCIASHRSAFSNENRETLKEYCRKLKKQLIFFSGGITSSVFKDNEFPFLHVNLKDFYSVNLKLFLDYYESTNTINLPILQFGLKWKLSLLLYLRNLISVSENKRLMKANNQHIDIDNQELIKRVRDLQLNSLIKPDLTNDKTSSVITGGDFALITPGQIMEIKTRIDQLIDEML